ncbi:hypothetical protein Dehly_1414 [Dehalogenimonas lykanthroporepellens BL-DC-9]|nr:hypothetical protein Dehly_1414 [Dehalogenimonas lykanthroporepellens BL-DC-9]
MAAGASAMDIRTVCGIISTVPDNSGKEINYGELFTIELCQ